MRDQILARVREAAARRPPAPHPGEPPPGRPETAIPPLEAFRASFNAAGGEVEHFADPAAARAWAAGLVEVRGGLAQSPLVPESLRLPEGSGPPEGAALGVSVALYAAADTGSLVLTSREGRGLQLLPPTHLVWVPARAVLATLHQALVLARSEAAGAVAVHSGPSKSADIGQVLVRGVHGPGRVIAAVVEGLEPLR